PPPGPGPGRPCSCDFRSGAVRRRSVGRPVGAEVVRPVDVDVRALPAYLLGDLLLLGHLLLADPDVLDRDGLLADDDALLAKRDLLHDRGLAVRAGDRLGSGLARGDVL